jgi:RND family efflux transporter MFP subunit
VERQSAEVQRAEAAVANARANRARERDLFERGVAARKEVEDADRALADAEAALAQAQASRGAAGMVASRAVARATFDGVVAKRYHNPGDFVDASASDPVMRVIDLGRLEVVASVPLADAPRVVVGAAARITGASDAPALKVLSRPATVEEGTATVAIRLGFAGPVRYPAHAPVAVDIDSEKHTDVIVIPERALVRDAAETAVFVVSGGKAQRRPVETGLTDGSQIEITSGLKAGEVVIVEGQTGLPDGAAVNATGENAPEKTLEKEPAKEPGKESGKESEK